MLLKPASEAGAADSSLMATGLSNSQERTRSHIWRDPYHIPYWMASSPLP